jgi:hypothetical protein
LPAGSIRTIIVAIVAPLETTTGATTATNAATHGASAIAIDKEKTNDP